MTVHPLGRLIAAVSLVFLSDVSAALSQSISIAGVWQTSEGSMELTQKGSEVSGPYAQDGGRVFGTLGDNVLQGIWVERDSNVTCDQPRDGSLHWGSITFTFNADVTAFSGAWEYCDGTSGASWTGQLVESSKMLIID
jgi:hypothetical protein